MADRIAMASSLIAAVGLLFTGYQVFLLNRQFRYERRVAVDGVAVTWRPVEAPSRVEQEDGTSSWLYEVVLVNPGRLPVDDVKIRWVFPCDVVRLRSGGPRDAATRKLTLSSPVLAGGGQRTWQRRLLIDYAAKDSLVEVYAEVSFTDIEGRRVTNRWPRRPRRPLGAPDGG